MIINEKQLANIAGAAIETIWQNFQTSQVSGAISHD